MTDTKSNTVDEVEHYRRQVAAAMGLVEAPPWDVLLNDLRNLREFVVVQTARNVERQKCPVCSTNKWHNP